MPQGHLPVVSYLAVPVVSQSGIVIGGLFFGHPEPAMFKEEHEVLVEAVANQAAVALDNAKLYEEIRSLNAKKDEFIGFASHELKTPLTTISGYLQLAEQSPEMTGQFLPKINKQVTRLSAIISDLLDISKIQAGKFDLRLTEVSIQSLIKESVEAVKQLSPKHEIKCEFPTENTVLLIDNTKMSQVLINVLTNAIKYSPDSYKIVISAVRLGDEAQISVRDWGTGIAAEHLDKIFSQFYRVSKTSDKIQGMGLGLYFCKEILEAHHGKIWAESTEGEGTTIHISLPIRTIID
jgi:signal transduction histidine kinase